LVVAGESAMYVILKKCCFLWSSYCSDFIWYSSVISSLVYRYILCLIKL